MIRFRVIYLYIPLFLFLCGQSFYVHREWDFGNWRSQMWADKAGYYIYLPALFIYDLDMNPKRLPEKLLEKTGYGFGIDSANSRFTDKYYCGVSIMQAPFFLGAHAYTKISGDYPANGFSTPYHRAIDIAAIFYLTLGLYLLHLSLKLFFKSKFFEIFITLLFTFTGTNLFYYSVIESGMAHIYSFFWFSVIMYMLVQRPFIKEFKFILFFGIASSFIIALRPLNIIFLPIVLVWNTNNIKEILDGFRGFLRLRIILTWLITFFIIYLPQILFWKYSRGQYFYNNYGNEHFDNLYSPKFGMVLFAPQNGLFIYSMIVLFMFIGLFFLARNYKITTISIIAIISALIFLSAAWWAPNFGCSCGQRCFVEYYALLVFPFYAFIQYVLKLRWQKYIIFAVMAFLALENLKINYNYSECYFCDIWEWKCYREFLDKPNFFFPIKF